MKHDNWKKTSPTWKRLYTIIAAFLVLVLTMMLGAAKPLTVQEVEELGKIPEQLDSMLQNMSLASGTLWIFGNNFMASLLGFVPFAGPVFTAYAVYNSGVTSEAFMLRAAWQGPPFLLVLKLFVFHSVGWNSWLIRLPFLRASGSLGQL